MNIFDALNSIRPGHTSYAAINDESLSYKEFLEKTLVAVKRRRGLIHGDLVRNGRVCGLGALATMCGGSVTLNTDWAKQLQEVNDAVPKATPAGRRARVIRWLEQKLKELKS